MPSDQDRNTNSTPFMTRRHFLRGVGVAVALPMLESLRPGLLAADAAAGTRLAVTATGAPLRAAFLFFPSGAIPATWWPAREGAVDARVRQRDRLGCSLERLRLRNCRSELVEHRASRLDRHDLETERGEAPRQLSRPRADIESPRPGVEADLLRGPAERPLRIPGPVSLVLRRHGLEAARARCAVRHGWRGRGR